MGLGPSAENVEMKVPKYSPEGRKPERRKCESPEKI